MNQDLNRIKKDLFKDLEIKDFYIKHKMTDLDLLSNLSKFYIHKEYNDKASKCTSDNCVMDPYGQHTKLDFVNNNVELSYVNCPTLVNRNVGNVDLMFFPNQEEMIKKELNVTQERALIIKLINEFINNYQKGRFTKGIYLYGEFGTGKTFIMYTLAKQLASRGVKVILVNYSDLILSLKNSFGTSQTERLINKIKYVDVLIIDDIGAESNTAYTRDDVFYPLINFRLQSNLPVCMTSNYDFSMLTEHFGESRDGINNIKSDRIIERLKYLMKDVRLVDKNYRL
jgi:primosomal protein DnaI